MNYNAPGIGGQAADDAAEEIAQRVHARIAELVKEWESDMGEPISARAESRIAERVWAGEA